MRSASSVDIGFPYTSKLVCYFEVYKNGEVKRVYHKNKSDFNCVVEAYKKASEGTTTLYAVWPGNYSSDLFIIDDLEAFALNFEVFSVC